MPIAALDQTFVFKTGENEQPIPNPPGPASDPLQTLIGTWQGRGFNAIWIPRPLGTSSRHFLMLNLTVETLSFARIAGVIPNRGLLQPDIGMTGITYMDQIADTAGNGLHIEPGIWAVVPATTAPAIPQSVVRIASIPHGTSILAQGTAVIGAAGPPTIGSASLVPTLFDGGAPKDFPERHLDQATDFRTAPLPPQITQALLDDPNTLLSSELTGLTVTSTTTLDVTTTSQPVPAGGSANTAFLAGTNPNHEQGNASANQVDATFWIEEIAADGDRPAFRQLQYTQTVILDFSGLRWPHVTVGTLRQISTGPEPVVPAPPAVIV